jgi:hypothetical protein
MTDPEELGIAGIDAMPRAIRISRGTCAQAASSVIASEAKQSMDVAEKEWIASSLCSSQ